LTSINQPSPTRRQTKWFEEAVLPPCGQGGRKIQLPYINKFETIWEYKEAFFSHPIDFVAYIGPKCPICGDCDCYQEIDPYWRYAIDLFPVFKKEEVPIARFLCQKHKSTFSLLPIQLIPYFQYTVSAVIGTLFCGLSSWQMGQGGFYGAEASVDPEAKVTAWLVFCWLMVMVRGLRRSHAELMLLYDLSRIQTSETKVPWQEFSDYLAVFGIDSEITWRPRLHILLYRYIQRTRLFLFGTPSQYRSARA
jgi:hypothetical protein